MSVFHVTYHLSVATVSNTINNNARNKGFRLHEIETAYHHAFIIDPVVRLRSGGTNLK
jgi:hypothetical protein